MTSQTRVLIVDDQPGMLRTTAMVLSRKGYFVDTAPNGLSAIEKLNGDNFDVVLMDIKMPLLNGVDAYQRIKSINPKVAVIMMTAYAVEELVSEALDNGAFAVVFKPLDIDRIINLIDRAKEIKKGVFLLIVDDNPNDCKILTNLLVKKGYSVGTVGDGDSAIARAKEFKYDIILIDLKLPTINGFETLLGIREIDPDVVAIMMTAYRDEMAELIQAALEKDVYTCLYKPIDVKHFLTLIEHISSHIRKKRFQYQA